MTNLHNLHKELKEGQKALYLLECGEFYDRYFEHGALTESRLGLEDSKPRRQLCQVSPNCGADLISPL